MYKYFLKAIIVFFLFIGSLQVYSNQLPDTITNKGKTNMKEFYSRHHLSLSLGMGISLLNNSSFASYLRREIPYSNSDSIKSFNAGIEFFGGIEYMFSKNFAMKLDYSYYIRSLTYTFQAYTYDYSINIHQPYLMAYYVMQKNSFDLKFGAGA